MIDREKADNKSFWGVILYIYFMPVCSIVETNTLRCCGQPDALYTRLKAECNSASGRPRYRGVMV